MNRHQLSPWIGPIDSENCRRLFADIAKAGEGSPLQLVISSCGGMIPIGFAAFDAIRAGAYDLRTIGSGQICSAALMVFLAGTERLLAPHAFIHFREISFEVDAIGLEIRGSKARQDIKEIGQRHFIDIVKSRCGKKLEEQMIAKLIESEEVLSPEEALKCGLAQGIVKIPFLFC